MNKKIRSITRYDEARRYADLCMSEGGGLMAMREMFEGGMQTVLKTRSGAVQAVIGVRCEHMFAPVFAARGAGDGLFPGFDQTTR